MEQRKPHITQEDVWGACDEILLSKERPTIERVRQHLGRGSPNTITHHINSWFESLGSRIVDPAAFAASNDLPDPIAKAAQYLWEAAMAHARNEAQELIEAELDTIAKREEQLAESLARLEQDVRLWEERVQSSLEAKHLADKQSQEAQSRASLLESQLSQALNQLADHATRHDLDRSAIDELERNIREIEIKAVERLDDATTQHREQERFLALQLDAARQEARKVEIKRIEDKEAAQQELFVIKEELAVKSQALSSAELRISQLLEEIERLKEKPVAPASISPRRTTGRVLNPSPNWVKRRR